jgi:hypothetical protein
MQRLIESRGLREGSEDPEAPDKASLLRTIRVHKGDVVKTFTRLERYAEDEDWRKFGGELFNLFRSLSGLLIHFGVDASPLDKLKQRVMNHGYKYR